MKQGAVPRRRQPYRICCRDASGCSSRRCSDHPTRSKHLRSSGCRAPNGSEAPPTCRPCAGRRQLRPLRLAQHLRRRRHAAVDRATLNRLRRSWRRPVSGRHREAGSVPGSSTPDRLRHVIGGPRTRRRGHVRSSGCSGTNLRFILAHVLVGEPASPRIKCRAGFRRDMRYCVRAPAPAPPSPLLAVADEQLRGCGGKTDERRAAELGHLRPQRRIVGGRVDLASRSTMSPASGAAHRRTRRSPRSRAGTRPSQMSERPTGAPSRRQARALLRGCGRPGQHRLQHDVGAAAQHVDERGRRLIRRAASRRRHHHEQLPAHVRRIAVADQGGELAGFCLASAMNSAPFLPRPAD